MSRSQDHRSFIAQVKSQMPNGGASSAAQGPTLTGGALIYPGQVIPAGFTDQASLMLWYLSLPPAGPYQPGGQIWSCKGISLSTAAIGVNILYFCAGILYMSPSQANQAWYYLINYLGVNVGPCIGPVVPASDVQKYGLNYVAITLDIMAPPANMTYCVIAMVDEVEGLASGMNVVKI